MVRKIGKNQKRTLGWEISAKNYILAVQENQRACKCNKANRILEINPWKAQLQVQWLKSDNMRIGKRIEKEK